MTSPPLRGALAVLIPLFLSFWPSLAVAQDGLTDTTSPLTMIAILGAMALLPFLLIMVTSFVKVAVVLSILRTAIGAQQVPPNQVITGLAIILTIYIMAPIGIDTYDAFRPHIDDIEAEQVQINLSTLEAIADDVAQPLHGFLMTHADPDDRAMLHQLALEMHHPDNADFNPDDDGYDDGNDDGEPHLDPDDPLLSDDSFLVLIPAFVVTELRLAFIIGFILFVPFIVIDLVVANILLSLGMHMLSPTTISLPFKLLLFVLVDGWYLVVQGLILSYL